MKNTENNYGLPDAYFETLTDRIQTEIFLRDLKDKISGTGFSVPNNYFENFTNKINDTVLHRQSDNGAIVFYLSIKKYAAAAMVILAIGLGIYFENTKQNTIQNQLATLPVNELENYLQNTSSSGDMALIIENIHYLNIKIDTAINTEELNNYINTNL